MKRWLRITLWSLAILIFAGGIGWFWYMSRSLPKHARCIPRSSTGVLLLNSKELFMDVYFGGKLYEDSLDINDYPLAKKMMLAVRDNGGAGIAFQSDMLAFAETDSSGHLSYFGLVMRVSDEEQLQRLAQKELPGIFNGKYAGGAQNYFVIDSTKTYLGWKGESALILQAAGEKENDAAAKHLIELLNLPEEQSVLADDNFKSFCYERFDAGIWLNGSALEKTAKHMPGFFSAGDDYTHLLVDFKDGEMEAVCRRFNVKQKEASPSNDPMLFEDPDKLAAFIRFSFDPQAREGSLFSQGSLAWQWLKNETGNAEAWTSCLDGNASISMRDSVSYARTFITYDYDDNFNPIEVVRSEQVTIPGITACFSLKNPAAMKKLVEEKLQNDSLAKMIAPGKYRLRPDQPWYVSVEQQYLFISTGDGAKKSVKADPGSGSVIYPVRMASQIPAAWRNDAWIRMILPEWKKHVLEIRARPFLREGSNAVSYTVISFRNKNVNALAQLSDMSRKAGKLAQ